MKNSLKHRPFNLIALAFLLAGFVFSYLDEQRVDNRFGLDSFQLGYGTANMHFIQCHYGGISVSCFAIAVFCHFIQHHLDANKK